MQHCNGRIGALAALLCLGLAACQTLPPPSTLPQSQRQALEQRGTDGSFEGAFDTAQTFERFNDPRAIAYYERAAAVAPWTFHNTKAEEALGRIWISGTLRHADSPHINPAPVLRASWRRGRPPIWRRPATAIPMRSTNSPRPIVSVATRNRRCAGTCAK